MLKLHFVKMYLIIVVCVLLSLNVCGCRKEQNDDFIGSALLEATTVTASTTVGGKLISMTVDEGDSVLAGQVFALVDTVPLYLKLGELDAAEIQLKQQRLSLLSEKEAFIEEIKGVKRELDRISGLADKGAVPVQKKDQLQTKYNTLKHKLESVKHKVQALGGKKKSISSKRSQLNDQIKRCNIESPFNGRIITVYKHEGEVAGPGIPVAEIAKYDEMKADFFVPQPLLSELNMNKEVFIRIDNTSSEGQFIKARITWISDEAEFTPENIQTREARNGLVFRVRVVAENKNGILKRGLPVEIWKAVQ